MQPLSKEDIQKELANYAGWSLIDQEGVTTLVREIIGKDFVQAFAIMTQIAILAEKQDHHPDWTQIYNKIQIRLSTHDARGVTIKDFALAKVINQIHPPK